MRLVLVVLVVLVMVVIVGGDDLAKGRPVRLVLVVKSHMEPIKQQRIIGRGRH